MKISICDDQMAEIDGLETAIIFLTSFPDIVYLRWSK